MRLLRLTLVEMRRALHRRLVWWTIALALLLCAFQGLVAFTSSADTLAADHPARMSRWWIAGTGDGQLLVGAVFLVVGAAICAASVAGAEWRAGTVTTLLTWQPSRWRLHGSRAASAAILALAISLVLQIVFLAMLLPAVLANDSTSGVDASFWMSLAVAMLRISGIVALVALLAFSIATVGRNTSAALIVLAAWALIVERLVAGLRPQWARFMITENVATVVPWAPMTGVEFERSPLVALTALVVYCAVVAAVAAWTFARRDIATS